MFTVFTSRAAFRFFSTLRFSMTHTRQNGNQMTQQAAALGDVSLVVFDCDRLFFSLDFALSTGRPVPRKFSECCSHQANVSHSRKKQPGAHKPCQAEKPWGHHESKKSKEEDHASGDCPDLALQ